MPKVALLTVSDMGFAGKREDRSGDVVEALLKERLGYETVHREILPDEQYQIESLLCRWVDDDVYDLILTSGGTGISPRDVTPQATLNVIRYEIPGMAEKMRAVSFKKTPTAALSRAVAGIRGRTLIVNLPGSPKGAQECLEAILPILPHALEQISSNAGHQA
jgi:molybdenum cofactor synthesis domain-containing protein